MLLNYIRKMLLMKDRSFLYELRPYLIYVKVGEKMFIFYIQVDNDKLYHGTEKRLSTVYFFLYLSIFLITIIFADDISTTV